MQRLLALVTFLAAAAWSCDKSPLSEKKEADDAENSAEQPVVEPGTLAVGDKAETAIQLAGTNLSSVSQDFVPASMASGTATVAPGTVAVDPQGAALLDGPPQYCVDHPGDQMCTDCGPDGTLGGSQTCSDFFGPGGQGYTEGEQLGGGGTDGGQQGGDQGGQGPCEGRGFFDCQPVLVKLYLKIARDSVSQVGDVLKNASAMVKTAKESTGTITPGDGEFSAIDYRVNGDDDMEFLFKDKDAKPVVHAVLKGTTYAMSLSGLGGDGGSAQVRVEFTDDTHWTTDLIVDHACNPEDAQAPKTIAIRMSRGDGLWQGKAMMLSPHWPQGTCDDPVTESSGLSINTDIVGEKDYTTASLFMVPLGVADLGGDTIQAYSIQKVCANFPGICGGDPVATQAMGDTLKSNPFCSKADGTHSWGAACTKSTVPEVAAGTYGAQDLWRSPKDLSGAQIEVPAAL